MNLLPGLVGFMVGFVVEKRTECQVCSVVSWNGSFLMYTYSGRVTSWKGFCIVGMLMDRFHCFFAVMGYEMFECLNTKLHTQPFVIGI